MDKQPSDMTDEELDAAIGTATSNNEEAPADPPAEQAKEEEAQEPKEPEPPEEPAAEDGQPEAETQPEPKMSRREQLRVADLLKKYGEPKQEPKQTLNFRDKIEADEEVHKQLEETANNFAAEQFNAGLERAKSIQFHTRLEIDAPRVEAKYPKLDKNSDQFDAEAANDVNQLYLQVVGYNPESDMVTNPNIRYADFVEAWMNTANRLASAQAAQTAKNVAAQAAQTGLRPDGSASKGLDLTKAPQDMTDEELDAVIANITPRDRFGRFVKK